MCLHACGWVGAIHTPSFAFSHSLSIYLFHSLNVHWFGLFNGLPSSWYPFVFVCVCVCGYVRMYVWMYGCMDVCVCLCILVQKTRVEHLFLFSIFVYPCSLHGLAYLGRSSSAMTPITLENLIV